MAELQQYPERRFFVTSNPRAHSDGGPTFADRLDELDWARNTHNMPIWEAIPKADMDRLRDLARAVRDLNDDEDGDCTRVLEIFDALPPAFLMETP